MKTIFLRFIFCIVFTLPIINTVSLKAQTLTQSPYSRFGLGEIQKEEFAQNAAMSGVSQTFQSSNLINISNPASLGALKYTTFQAALAGTLSQQSTNTLSQKTQTASFSSIALAFPITKWWGSSFGLKPYSNMGYKINYSTTDTVFGDVNYNFKGNGGLTKVFFSNGFKPVKNVYIGANATYLFGVLNKERKVAFAAENYLNTVSQEATNISGFAYNVGAQFKVPLKLYLTKTVQDTSRKDSVIYFKKPRVDWRKKEYSIQLGATAQNNSSINAVSNALVRSYKIENEIEKLKDTVSYVVNNKGKITLPQTLAMGISFTKGEKLFFGVDYSIENWTQFKYFGASDFLQNASSLNVGVQYTPKPGFIGNVFQRASYRAGFRNSNTFLNLKNTPITEKSVSIGGGFPLRRSTSSVNVALELGKRGTLTNDLIEENFFRFTVAFSLNDVWFIKRKLD